MTSVDLYHYTTNPAKPRRPDNLLRREQLEMFRDWLLGRGWTIYPAVDYGEVMCATHPSRSKDIVVKTKPNDVTNYIVGGLTTDIKLSFMRYRRDQERYMDNRRARNECNSNRKIG